jgi:hypothetical protein
MHAQLIEQTGNRVYVRVPKPIVSGSTVQVRSGESVAFGLVSDSVAAGPEYEIEVEVQRAC